MCYVWSDGVNFICSVLGVSLCMAATLDRLVAIRERHFVLVSHGCFLCLGVAGLSRGTI